jgi:DNA-binding CsgD family transcriptional regulator
MSLVLREGQALILSNLLKDAIGGEGNVAVVSGAAGMGKSSLLAAVADESAARGAVLLTASCSRSETKLPFAVIGQLMRCWPGGAPAWSLLPSWSGEATVGDLDDDDTSSAAMTACTVLLELAERRPVALVVDDAQLADQPSATCLSYLVRRVRPGRMLAVFSQQEIAWRPPTALQAELLRQPRCRLLRLTPLAETDVARVVSAGLGEQAAARLASSWHQISGGNPSLLQALLADYPEPGNAYGRAVISCLHSADPALQQLAAGLAVLGADSGLSTADLSRLTGIDADMLESGLRSLSDVGLIGRDHRFRHPLARSTILVGLDRQQRAELHGRAAEIAFSGGLPAEHVAGHLRAAAASGPWAVPVLEQAARTAIDDGRIEAAVDYLKLAQDACTDDQHRAAIRTTLIRAEWRIDPGIPTAALTELVTELDQGYLRGPDLVVLAKALLWHGRTDEARNVLRQLGRSIASSPGAATAQIAAELRALHPWLRCTYPPVLAHCPAVPDDGSPPPAATILHRQEAAVALAAVLTEGPAVHVLPALERILRYSRLDDVSMDAEECALLAMVFGGHLDRAMSWNEAFTTQAVTRNATSRQARLSAIRAEIGLRQGDLAAAARFGQLALRLMPPSGWGVAIGAPLSAAVLALTAMGQMDAAAGLIRRPVPEAMLETRHGLQYMYARGQHQLAVGNAAAALADFHRIGELMRAWQLDAPVLLSWRLAAAEALLRTGQKSRARDLIEDQMTLSRHMSSREQGSAARLLAITSEVSGRPGLLREAAELLQVAGDRYELGRTLVALASAYHKAGDARRARIVRRQALAVAEECRAEPLIRDLSADPETVSRAEPSVLSETERRVAELAAIGYSNRDISEKLFITVSTVEQHLTRTYRKLNLNGRGELPASPVLTAHGLTRPRLT